ncbi:reverse transcriptase-like [Tropilaelaps mercedesae]|uniref:Reverse transcriptase-like n=1 Tax=Tropilaelaps mercedesae TaxID=418985 RepID=A0A1V9X4A6_9ACAR|nr:reverse transcriptase-like [Tropilaelaps mercedesae]
MRKSCENDRTSKANNATSVRSQRGQEKTACNSRRLYDSLCGSRMGRKGASSKKECKAPGQRAKDNCDTNVQSIQDCDTSSQKERKCTAIICRRMSSGQRPWPNSKRNGTIWRTQLADGRKGSYATWMNGVAEHTDTTYRLTQMLTGHGCVRHYLYRIRKANSPICDMCNSGEDDTAEHTLFNCHRYEEERAEMNRRIGQVATTEDLVIMLASEDGWQAVEKFSEAVIKRKEANERHRPRHEID